MDLTESEILDLLSSVKSVDEIKVGTINRIKLKQINSILSKKKIDVEGKKREKLQAIIKNLKKSPLTKTSVSKKLIKKSSSVPVKTKKVTPVVTITNTTSKKSKKLSKIDDCANFTKDELLSLASNNNIEVVSTDKKEEICKKILDGMNKDEVKLYANKDLTVLTRIMEMLNINILTREPPTSFVNMIYSRINDIVEKALPAISESFYMKYGFNLTVTEKQNLIDLYFTYILNSVPGELQRLKSESCFMTSDEKKYNLPKIVLLNNDDLIYYDGCYMTKQTSEKLQNLIIRDELEEDQEDSPFMIEKTMLNCLNI